MATKKTISYGELRVGIVITIGLMVLMSATMYVTREGGLPFLGGQYTIYSYLRDVNGLKAGSPVHLSGVEVGTVNAVEFSSVGDPAPVKVTMSLSTEVQQRVTENSLVTVGSLGVLGEKMLDVDPGPPGGVVIGHLGRVPGEAEGDPIKGIITDASATMRDLRDLSAEISRGEGTLGEILTKDELYNAFLVWFEKAQEIFTSLDNMEGTFGKLIHDPNIYDNLNLLTEGMQEFTQTINSGDGAIGKLLQDGEVGERFARLSSNLASVTDRVKAGEGTLGALVSERALYDSLSSLSSNIDSLSHKIERGDGTAGQLIYDRALYDNLNSTAQELTALLSDIREDPKRYLRIKVSLF